MSTLGLRWASVLAVVFASVASAASAATHAADTAGVAPARVAAMADRYLTERTRLGRFSGAVLIARHGRVVFRKGYGFADVQRRIPYTPETQQPIASLTKMFTAMAAMRLRDAGKLSLSDPVCAHLDSCPPAWREITLDQLVHHTSGIPDYEERLDLGSEQYEAFMTRREATREILAQALADTLTFAPGSQFHYSNTGYIVLAHAVENAAGRPFTDCVRATLLEPAGMTHSGSFGGATTPKRLARGYTQASLGWKRTLAGVGLTDGHLSAVPALPLTPPAGDAGMFSTVDDLLRWANAMTGGDAIPRADAVEATTPGLGLGHYGAGWIMDDFQGIEFTMFPDAGVTVIVLSNLEASRTSRVVRDLSAIALGLPWDMPVHGNVIELAPAAAAKLEGMFRMPEGDTLTIANDPPMISAAIPGRFLAGLIPLSPTTAYMPLAEGRATFTLGRDGRATRVNLHYDGRDHIAQRIGTSK